MLRLMAPISLGALLMVAFAPIAARADIKIVDPPVFASRSGSLDLVMVAGPVPQTYITQGVTTTAWVYQVCQRTAPMQNKCPDGSAHPLGGVHLQLTAGDTLKIRLVNNLPLIDVTGDKHVAENPSLAGNPTNLHTHGLIVEPHRAEGPNDPYGDYVFVELLNPANGAAPPPTVQPMQGAHTMVHPDMDVASGALDYAIQIPANHPSGLYWFHPHIHGVSVNQITAGMSGIITIGTPEGMCGDAACVAQVRAGAVHHIVLKDMQILADNTLHTQPDPTFCGVISQPAPNAVGVCAGDPTADPSYAGGSWFHTINGQVYPTIDVAQAGDIWRILNSSPSRSYQLSLDGDDTGKPVLMQVLSLDGVTIDSLALDARGSQEMARMLGGKAKPVPCPQPSSGGPSGLCTTTLRLMPSSRAEVRVVKQTAQTATFRTALYTTGPSGDSWPAIDLAHVTFAAGNNDVLPPLVVGTQGRDAMSAKGALMGDAELRPRGSMSLVNVETARAAAGGAVTGSAHHEGLVQAPSIAIDSDLKLGLRSSSDCVPLKEGHHRRIFFGYPTTVNFGLGYVEVDEKGREIEATRKAVLAFDPTGTTVCVPLGAKGAAVKEVWEFINLTGEDHNFHIHQTRFRLLSGGATAGTIVPTTLTGGLVLHDNVPLPSAVNASFCDGTAVPFYSGACRPVPVVVEIPFREIGDFVYHCHILEHEDGGMMARVRVVASPKQPGQAARADRHHHDG
jgi:L-ascorbate oxidase